MIDYLLDALFLLLDAPNKILILGVMIAVFYCASMIIVGFPTSIWEAVTKKKANEALEKKVIIAVTILLIIGAIILELHQKTH